MRSSSILLCSFLLLCGVLASSWIIHQDDIDKLENDVKNDEVRNAYMVWVNLHQIKNIQESNSVYVRFFDNSTVLPVNSTGNGPFSFTFPASYVQMGLSTSKSDFNSSIKAGFYIYNNLTHELIDTVTITQVIVESFPNTSDFNGLKLWPTQFVSVNGTSAKGTGVDYTIKYEGVLDVFGLNVHWPLWKVLVVVISVKVGLSFFLALLDWCCQPLHRTSTGGKISILFGNWLWLVFGGFAVGFSYMLAGFILILTCILSPFGFKLVRIGVFAMLPFGREIRADEERNHQTCSTIGNVLWVVFIGFPIVLTHLLLGIILTVLIVTFPFALQHFKLAKIAFMPFGHSVVFRENRGDSEPHERAPLYQNANGSNSGALRYA